jgi:hypothetical protein
MASTLRWMSSPAGGLSLRIIGWPKFPNWEVSDRALNRAQPGESARPRCSASVWVATIRLEPKVAHIHGLGVYPANLCPLSCLVELASLAEDFG